MRWCERGETSKGIKHVQNRTSMRWELICLHTKWGAPPSTTIMSTVTVDGDAKVDVRTRGSLIRSMGSTSTPTAGILMMRPMRDVEMMRPMRSDG